MGEIGRDRREYLYEMSYLDILMIQRGYRRRNILQYQLQRLQAYGAIHCMSGSKMTPQEWQPMYIDRYIDDDQPVCPLSDAEIDELQAEMSLMNQKSD